MITIDRKQELPTISFQCLTCRHRNHQYGKDRTCEAFPEGIPLALLIGEVKHDKPYANDRGIRYEPLEIEQKVPIEVS